MTFSESNFQNGDSDFREMQIGIALNQLCETLKITALGDVQESMKISSTVDSNLQQWSVSFSPSAKDIKKFAEIFEGEPKVAVHKSGGVGSVTIKAPLEEVHKILQKATYSLKQPQSPMDHAKRPEPREMSVYRI